MIVIPCRYDPAYPLVQQAVAGCQKFLPDERVVVVDSDSPDRSYMDEVRMLGAEVADVANRHYEAGAWWWAWEHYPDEPYYYCIHDSCEPTADWREFTNRHPVSTVLSLPNWNNAGPVHYRWAQEHLPKTKYSMLDAGFTMLFGTMVFIQRALAHRLLEKGASGLRPVDKVGSCAMERVLGVMLAQENHPIVPSMVAWDGHVGDSKDTPWITKRWVHRK